MHRLAGVSRSLFILCTSLLFAAGLAQAQQTEAPPYEHQLDDAQLVDIVISLNEVEVQTNELGAGKAQASEVQEFAQRMVEEHKKALASLQREDLTPEPNEVSQTLRDTGKGLMDMLEQEPAESFDQTFMEIQISLHQTALNLLDYTVIPLIEDNQQREQLIQLRHTVHQHQRDAWKLYRGLDVAE